jgi:hypothetical protein
MEIIKCLFKIVGNPKTIKNYEELSDFFHKKGEKNIVDAINYLIEAKNATNNSNNNDQ